MKKFINIITLVFFFNACSTTTNPPKTQLQVREYQTRYFEVNDKNIIMKAVVNTLLDDGYIMKNVNTELGIITAEKGSAIKEKEARNSSIWTAVIVGAIIILTLGIILLVSKDKKDSGDKGSSPPPQSSNKEELYEKNKIIETTINVSEFSSGYKVRAVFQKKVLNNRGEITSIENIDDMKFYQDFFSKLDKSIFLQKELENK
jgi:hypothetical protein